MQSSPRRIMSSRRFSGVAWGSTEGSNTLANMQNSRCKVHFQQTLLLHFQVFQPRVIPNRKILNRWHLQDMAGDEGFKEDMNFHLLNLWQKSREPFIRNIWKNVVLFLTNSEVGSVFNKLTIKLLTNGLTCRSCQTSMWRMIFSSNWNQSLKLFMGGFQHGHLSWTYITYGRG